MKTSQLIDVLARGAGTAPRGVIGRRLGPALGFGMAASVGISVLGLGLNPVLFDMGSALALKLAYVAGLTMSAAWLVARLSRPGASWRGALIAAAFVLACMGVPALISWLQADAARQVELLYGQSWAVCPWRVAALSTPGLLLGVRAVRGLAPTRLRLAGAAAGLTAGGLGAFGYALHCPEVSPVFVLTWYTLGMLVPAVLGAIVGPNLLRW